MTLKLREHAEGVVISVRAQPGAKRSAVVGLHDGGLKIAVSAPPLEGRANDALADFLRMLFGLRRSQVELIQGEKSRSKTFLLRGIAAQVNKRQHDE